MSKRIAWIATGTVAILAGGAIGIAGVAINEVFGGDDTITSGSNRVTTSARALVTKAGEFDDDASDSLGRPSVTISVSRSTQPIFIGVAPAAAVDRYLAGASVATVTDVDVDPFRLETELAEGTATPRPPGAETFWVARSDGSTPLEWKLDDGNHRIVMMNADGSIGVDADARFDLQVPHVDDIGDGLRVAGIIVAGLGIAAIAMGIASKKEEPRYAPYPGAHWPAPPVAQKERVDM